MSTKLLFSLNSSSAYMSLPATESVSPGTACESRGTIIMRWRNWLLYWRAYLSRSTSWLSRIGKPPSTYACLFSMSAVYFTGIEYQDLVNISTVIILF